MGRAFKLDCSLFRVSLQSLAFLWDCGDCGDCGIMEEEFTVEPGFVRMWFTCRN